MPRYRNSLPQTRGELFLTDGGLETTLIFHDGHDLPHFAAFDLLKTDTGRTSLFKYFQTYADLARRFDANLVLESATWRASRDWGRQLGYTPDALRAANRSAIELLEELRRDYDGWPMRIVISGCVGPRGDGYLPGDVMSTVEAEAYHAEQIGTLAYARADMIGALTMNYVEEAIGIARASKAAGIPVAISFTVETNGCLPAGEPLHEAIQRVDEATGDYPAYYMVNCAHPSHFEPALDDGAPWTGRIRGVRANASRMSHEELNEAEELDIGDRKELARDYARLKSILRNLNILGGCCGTDHRHIEEVAIACQPLFRDAVA